MVKTYGLTHIALAVRDLARSTRFYQDLLGAQIVYKVKRTEEFVPGEPFVFAADPDGYELELWYELPTAVDPPSRRSHPKRRARAA